MTSFSARSWFVSFLGGYSTRFTICSCSVHGPIQIFYGMFNTTESTLGQWWNKLNSLHLVWNPRSWSSFYINLGFRLMNGALSIRNIFFSSLPTQTRTYAGTVLSCLGSPRPKTRRFNQQISILHSLKSCSRPMVRLWIIRSLWVATNVPPTDLCQINSIVTFLAAQTKDLI